MHPAVLAGAGAVVLGGDGVEVAGEEEPRGALRGRAGDDAAVARVARRHAPGAQHVRDVLRERRLVVGLRRDVDELERPGGEALCEVGGHGGRVVGGFDG